MRSFTLYGNGLSLSDLESIARQGAVQIQCSSDTEQIIRRRRQLVEQEMQKRPIYGLNTGYGSRKNVMIAAIDIGQLQENYIASHCVGVGDPLPYDVVRAMMALRLNSFL